MLNNRFEVFRNEIRQNKYVIEYRKINLIINQILN